MSHHRQRPREHPTAPIRVAVGLVYFHFGILKLFPDLSPAELLAGQTLVRLGFGLDAAFLVPALGVFECVIGLLLLFRILPRIAVGLLFAHLAGTFVPLFALPELAFRFTPFAPTFEGQYILKNVVFVAAAWTLLQDAMTRPTHSTAQPCESPSAP